MAEGSGEERKRDESYRFGLVDCEAFYVSCERVFRPDLKGKPVVVLSSNDGCIVALSGEAKALGFKRGDPYFQVKETLERHGVAVFSSNFPLYSDLSRRVFGLLRRFPVEVEEYSVDEAFLRLPPALEPEEIEGLGRAIRHSLLQGIGIPARIGFAPTRTLAKMATTWIKIQRIAEGVFLLPEGEARREILAKIPIEEVWGIGPASAVKLARVGITTALELTESSPPLLRTLLGIAGARVQGELRGIPLLPSSLSTLLRKGVLSSHTFPEAIRDKETLYGILLDHLESALKRLERERLFARTLGIFLRTSRHIRNPSLREGRMQVPPRSYRALLQGIQKLLEAIYIPDLPYRKAGVFLGDLLPQSALPDPLFSEKEVERWQTLRGVIRRIHERYGPESLILAPQLLTTPALPSRNFRSPRYTTLFSELPRARA